MKFFAVLAILGSFVAAVLGGAIFCGYSLRELFYGRRPGERLRWWS